MSTLLLRGRRASMEAVRLAAALTLCALLLMGAAPSRAATNPRVDLDVAGRGVVTIELYPQAAPKSVAHFLKLVEEKFYDGLLFHRVVANFVVQTGDPKSLNVDGSKLRGLTDQAVSQQFGLGNGGSGETVPFEKNSYTHERGTIALALSQAASATGDSQFFINLKPNPPLNGGYCVFGKVVKGMDVVDKIQQGDRISSMRVVAAKSEASAPPKPSKGKKKP
jgi:peptidyl-prolyl cis-trans isomerase B (cyclophilin B)